MVCACARGDRVLASPTLPASLSFPGCTDLLLQALLLGLFLVPFILCLGLSSLLASLSMSVFGICCV